MTIVLALGALAMANATLAQDAPAPREEQWQELPRNTTIYVPVPKQVTPVAAYRSCANRYEGESCDFSTPRQGVIEGTCQAPAGSPASGRGATDCSMSMMNRCVSGSCF
jgi:hypothetical protein